MNLVKERLKKNDELKQKILGATILAIVVIVYNLTYLNKTLPITEGWHRYYVELIRDGYFPYRDFYYYLPPLNMLTDYALWTLAGDSFLIYRLLRLLERVVMMELLYCLLNKKFSTANSCLACCIGSILGTACVYDLIGDYNQTEVLLFITLGFVTFKYFDSQEIKKKKMYMFLAGITAGLMFLLKQSTFVAAGIVFVLVFLILCFIQKKEKHYNYLGYVLLGCVLPIIMCLGVLIYNGALTEFIFQVYGDTSSKGTLFDIILGAQIDIFQENIVQIILAICTVIYIYYKKIRSINNVLEKKNDILKLSIATLLGYLYLEEILCITSLELNTVGYLFLILSFIPLLIYLLMFFLNKDINDLLFFIISLLLLGVVALNDIEGIGEKIYTETPLFASITDVATLFYYILIVLLIIDLIYIFRKKESLISEQVLMLCCIGVASGYATTMASGMSKAVEARSAFIIVPVAICIFSIFLEKISKKILFILCLLLCLGTFAQKGTNTYSWWGNNTGKISEKVFTVTNDALYGFKFTADESKKYEEVIKLIENNCEKDDIIYGFPHIKMFNILTDRNAMVGFVPIPFYDVCTDGFARMEAYNLAMNNPDIIIWCDIPGCMELHEELFRDGEELGHREIQRWFASVKDESYELIGQVDNLFIYKLKNGTPIKYTYFENPSKENSTATITKTSSSTYDKDLLAANFEGEGTLENPYLIQNKEDLVFLRDCVNSGITFENEYILQTSNIYLEKGEKWTPIGIMGSGNYFAGTYNGNGYSIDGAVVHTQNQNAGFFGQLEGVVMNLSLTNISVKGACCGGIASHGIGSPLILNCFVSGTVTATMRAGGIADNFCGKIINCVSDCILIAPTVGDIVSYGATKVENNYSLRKNMNSNQIVEMLNTNLQLMEKYVDEVAYNKWHLINENQITLDSEKYFGNSNYSKLYSFCFVIGIGIFIANVVAKKETKNGVISQ